MPCAGCRDDVESLDFTMAFQPIFDAEHGRVWGHEALVRGPGGESAMSVLGQVNDRNRYRFDQDCRVRAIELAARLFPAEDDLRLSINFMPNAVYEPVACLRATLAAAARVGFPLASLVFELTEDERVDEPEHLVAIVDEYRRQGFTMAVDDFGAGHAGLSRLVDLRPDLVKIDMHLVRGIDTDASRQAVVQAVVVMASTLDVVVLAEGVETEAEYATLLDLGVPLFQGYWFGRPTLEALSPVHPRAQVVAAAAS
ncbi:EAL domain-containing protein [Aeromicrobium sp. REDSEA-S38_B2]|uniref:EAL domain-containing protein n=1 Tax=Aeromicrobium sp. REDSEA-S38_B2 TaxID=1811528 RepID=UPI0025805716|nr:EAL domain-containing protein [Aeromicrobium sp. REDSEA-S38_B2]